MRRLQPATVLVLSLALASGCGASMENVLANTSGRTVAVVSFAIGDVGDSILEWNGTTTRDLIRSRAATMERMIEQRLRAHWRVVPASYFVRDPAYQRLGVPNALDAPSFHGTAMPVLLRDEGSPMGGRITPRQARELSRITGADLLVVVYCKWGVDSSRIPATTLVRARTDTVIGIYDANGQLLVTHGAERRGSHLFSEMSRVVVNASSIDEWVVAFHESVALLLPG